MAVIKVTDIAYVRLRSPDLDVQAEFLDNFGLVPSSKSSKAIYYRATDPVHHVHITEKGDPKFVGIAYHAASEDDLKTLAKAPGASGIETLDEPGGGKRVGLRVLGSGDAALRRLLRCRAFSSSERTASRSATIPKLKRRCAATRAPRRPSNDGAANPAAT